MKKKPSKQKLQEKMLKTIIKGILLEMDIRHLFGFHREGTLDRILADTFPKAKPEAIKKLKAVFTSSNPKEELLKAGFAPDKAEFLVTKVEKAQEQESEKLMNMLGGIEGQLRGSTTITPAARTPEERAKLGAAIAGKTKVSSN